MAAITEVMQQGHRDCDELFATAESAVDKGDWSTAETSWSTFVSELEEHITIKEERLLFPALEESGGPTGPIQVMRAEHEQMRNLIVQINDALKEQDSSKFLGLSETFMMLMQQHNMKEEQILYPMLDQFVPHLGAQLE